MKVAVKQLNIVEDLAGLSNLGGLSDQTQKYVISEHMTYMYYKYGEKGQCIPCSQGVGPHGDSGHWYEDFVLFRALFYTVNDDYDFVGNDALDITDKITEYQLNKLTLTQ